MSKDDSSKEPQTQLKDACYYTQKSSDTPKSASGPIININQNKKFCKSYKNIVKF